MSINIYGTENKQNEQISRTHLTIVLKIIGAYLTLALRLVQVATTPKTNIVIKGTRFEASATWIHNRNTKNVIAIIVH